MKRIAAEGRASDPLEKAGHAGEALLDPLDPTELADPADLADLEALARSGIVAIIPAWNARGRLPAVLAALAGQVALAIVVDNGSEDGSAAALRSAGARLAWPAQQVRLGPATIAATDTPEIVYSGRSSAEAPEAAGATIDHLNPPSSASVEPRAGHPATLAVDPIETSTAGRWRLRLPVLLLVMAENLGYPSAVNHGLAWGLAAGARGLLLVNDDALFESGAVAALDRALAEDPRAAAATAKMLYAERVSVLNGTGGRYLPDRAWAALRGEGEPDRGQYDELPWVDYPSGAASLLRPAALESVGLLDEHWYLYYEDVDWGLRARAAGWRTRYVPQARVQHLGSAGTAQDPARRRYYNVRNRLRFARLHAPLAGRTRAWLETLRSLSAQALRWLWPSRRRDAEAVMLAVLDHLRGRYGRSARFG
jgi:GT2 family glycosyltransferase